MELKLNNAKIKFFHNLILKRTFVKLKMRLNNEFK